MAAKDGGTVTLRKRPTRQRGAPIDRNSDRKLPRISPEELTGFNESVNIMIFGDPGSWKTGTAGMAPRAVFLSTEKGVISAKRLGSTAKVLRCPDWNHVEAGLNWIDEHQGEFDWLIIDSLTKMQVLLIRWILQMANEDNEARDLDIPAIQDHQKWQNMFKRFVDRIIDMKINTIFVATMMHREDSEGEDLNIPDLQGKDYAISGYVTAQMDVVLFIGIAPAKNEKDRSEKAVHRILTEAWGPYQWCKDRFMCLPRYIDIREGDVSVMPRIIASIERSEEKTAVRSKARKSKADKGN
jgi:hypothetical protein